jgi:hypothetical protein
MKIIANIKRGQNGELGTPWTENPVFAARNIREYFYTKIRFSTPTCGTESALKALAGKIYLS